MISMLSASLTLSVCVLFCGQRARKHARTQAHADEMHIHVSYVHLHVENNIVNTDVLYTSMHAQDGTPGCTRTRFQLAGPTACVTGAPAAGRGSAGKKGRIDLNGGLS